jgi:hypothetical protein
MTMIRGGLRRWKHTVVKQAGIGYQKCYVYVQVLESIHVSIDRRQKSARLAHGRKAFAKVASRTCRENVERFFASATRIYAEAIILRAGALSTSGRTAVE